MRLPIHLVLTALTFSCFTLTDLFAEGAAAPADASHALERYVTIADSSYGWKKRREGKLGTGTYVELTLTSQTWRGTAWKHQLFIYLPSSVTEQADAILLIGGGSWDAAMENAPATPNEELPDEAYRIAAVGDIVGAPIAVVLQVPQQPLFDGMVEDELISFTFDQFLRSGDEGWPLLLPMVGSAVRAMDAVQEFAAEEWNLTIERFLVTGASKRGWTAWLTGAVDSRVSAIAPMVIDMLNMSDHMELQQLTFQGFSEQIGDYTEKELHKHLNTERGAALRAIVDPYSYRRKLTQPKLIILGTNDHYWPVDALNLYWEQLPGEKHILYVPNNGHGLRDYPRIVGAVAALHRSMHSGKPLPKLEWSFAENGKTVRLELSSDTPPAAVKVWTASAETRDFRQAAWKPQPAKPNGDENSFMLEVRRPKSGFSALFAEAQFVGGSLPFHLSTTIKVLPAASE